MPELPEVQTTVSGLNEKILNLTIKDVWTEYNSPYFHGSDTIKDPKYYKYFKRRILGKKILKVTRRAKNVLIHLESDITILIHMKMTGHIMYGDYNKKDPYNRFIRFIIYLSNGKNIELCDSRKFAKVTLLETPKIHESAHLKNIGPEPLEKDFDFDNFREVLLKKPKGKIKTVLMDQSVIAGIGNIYSDEMLWSSDIHPESTVDKIPKGNLTLLFKSMKNVLKKGIDFGGDSMSDYRNIDGERGKFQEEHNVYRKNKEKCIKKGCNGLIERKIIGGRSAHYCNKHQRLFK